MAKKKSKKIEIKKRDFNIEKHLRGEISLSTRKTKNKKAYTRKQKFKKNFDDYYLSF